jgi:hypothetical protein
MSEHVEGSRAPLMNKKGLIIARLKVHKNENFFGFDFEFCSISLLVISKY